MRQYSRQLIKILTELSVELDIKITTKSAEWIIFLESKGVKHTIYGYDWGINTATAQLVTKDKAATYDVLMLNNVDAMEHILIFGHVLQDSYFGETSGCWEKIINYAVKHNYKIVCKPNKGTGGNDIFFTSNQFELEKAVHFILSKYRDVCLSPFYNISNEYRVIILDGKALLTYRKERPYVLGNGVSPLALLILDKYGERHGDLYGENLSMLGNIIPNKQRVTLGSKHNLGAGSKANPFLEPALLGALEAKAREAADAVGIKFASVDIAEVDGSFLIAEINSGIMVEYFSNQPAEGDYNFYETAKGVFRDALRYIFRG